jgi:hypothetical protein
VDSVALEVAIGLALAFFITAVLVDAVNEVASRSLNIRSKALWARLDELLNNQDQSLGYPFIWKAVGSTVRPKHLQEPESAAPDGSDRLERFANTGSIHALDYVSADKTTKVWKIPGEVFASALIEQAEAASDDEGLPAKIKVLAGTYQDAPLGRYLSSTGMLLADNTDRFIEGVGRWYDGQMQVLSNTYRRNVRLILAVLGIAVALVFNVNAITIGQELAHNAALRQSAVVIAGEVPAGAFEECTDKQGEEQYACAADQIALFADAGVLIPFQSGYFDDLRSTWAEPSGAVDNALLVLGIAVTAAAVSFGGTFWFDFLRFLTGTRNRSK